MSRRFAILCPGRGSYTDKSLGSLSASDPKVQAAERLRAEFGLDSLLELDGAERFSSARHLRPANVSALIYLVSMLDAERALASGDAVCVAGNSMGWYTALAVAGALSFEDGFRLVQQMALFQEEGEAGGQVIYPLVDEDWQRNPKRVDAVERVLASASGEAFPSIHLGGYAVLAGSKVGLARLKEELPSVTQGKQTYPFQLALHGPYHTPLAAGVTRKAFAALRELEFHRPRITLIDGFGRRFTPWSTDVSELRDYTFDAQVSQPYDFTRSVTVALREYAPDQLVLPGPGNTLGGICGQILIQLGWQGIRTRDDFSARQESDRPIVESMRR